MNAEDPYLTFCFVFHFVLSINLIFNTIHFLLNFKLTLSFYSPVNHPLIQILHNETFTILFYQYIALELQKILTLCKFFLKRFLKRNSQERQLAFRFRLARRGPSDEAISINIAHGTAESVAPIKTCLQLAD